MTCYRVVISGQRPFAPIITAATEDEAEGIARTLAMQLKLAPIEVREVRVQCHDGHEATFEYAEAAWITQRVRRNSQLRRLLA